MTAPPPPRRRQGEAEQALAVRSATLAFGGLLSLAVAMGIGRFAFTPILPMMLRDGVVDLATASWLASANYLGYLAGAVFCTLQPALARHLPWPPAEVDSVRWVRTGLVATVLLTLGMALPVSALWPLLRFAAGVTSAFTLIHTSGWCLAQLAARGETTLGGLVFAGPGAGIVVSGLVAGGVVEAGGTSAVGWLMFALLAAVLVAAVWPIVAHHHEIAMAPARAPLASTNGADAAVAPAARHGAAELAALSFAYGLAGFGYIVTATFLPVIARASLPGSPWIALFWPVFGVGAFIGAVAVTRLRRHADARLMLVGAYLVQAAGIALGIVSPTLVGFVAGSFLVGLPFTTITFFALQEVRRLRPHRAASTIGLVTAVYGVGQVVGPPMVSRLVLGSVTPAGGFALSLEVAAASLVLGAAVYLAMWRRWPGRP